MKKMLLCFFPLIVYSMPLHQMENFLMQVEKKVGQTGKKYFKIQDNFGDGFILYFYDEKTAQSCSVVYKISERLNLFENFFPATANVLGPSFLKCKKSQQKKQPLSVPEIITIIKKVLVNPGIARGNSNRYFRLNKFVSSKDRSLMDLSFLDHALKRGISCNLEIVSGNPTRCLNPLEDD